MTITPRKIVLEPFERPGLISAFAVLAAVTFFGIAFGGALSSVLEAVMQ